MSTRVPTGIPGLDELIEGGFLEGSSILVAGGAGCGKTIFGMQYVYKGAEQYRDPGIYITIEESAKNIWWNMQSFHWDIARYQQQGLIKIYRMNLKDPKTFVNDFETEIERIKEMVNDMGARRLVIDSTTAFAVFMSTEADIRYHLFRLVDTLKELDVTTVLTAETLGSRDEFSRFGVEDFITDGVIGLFFKPPMRALLVKKMRGTSHDPRPHPMRIGPNGMEVNPHEQILWDALK